MNAICARVTPLRKYFYITLFDEGKGYLIFMLEVWNEERNYGMGVEENNNGIPYTRAENGGKTIHPKKK